MDSREADKIYLAGLFDGEGSIRITSSYIPRLKRKHVMMGVKIGMQSLQSVEVFAEYVDAKVIRHGKTYECGIWQRKASNFLVDVFPYLRCKRDRALYAIIAYEIMFGKRGKGAIKLTEKELRLRSILADIMKALNTLESRCFYGKMGEFEEQLSPLVKELEDMQTPSQAVEGLGSTEGVTTSQMSPNNNSDHERPCLYH